MRRKACKTFFKRGFADETHTFLNIIGLQFYTDHLRWFQMELQLYQVPFPKSFFLILKSKQNLPQIITQKSRHRCSIAINKVSQANNGLSIYKPSSWNHKSVESLDTKFPIKLKEKMKELEKKVIWALDIKYESGALSSLQLLELIDSIERLGLGYRFQDKIRTALEKIASKIGNNIELGEEEEDISLHAASLRFRLYRQHGYNVSQDFLKRFKDSHGGFMGCLQTDVKGLLSLYEASYLAFEEESDLHEAKLFATEHLLKLKGQENEVLEHVSHALELPLYRRMLRLQTRWYIDAYRKQKDANLLLLELAVLDFNMVQSALKRDLQNVSKWWGNAGLASKLCFIRDRLMECFFWTVGMVFEPQYHCCRVGLTKVAALITTLDDLYDVYGSLDELEIFTDAVKRWDVNMVKRLPKNLRISFLALYNTINDMGYNNTSSAQGEDTVPILRKVWGELCEAFLLEAKWTHNKYIPTLKDYLDNAWQSVSGVVMLTHGYFLTNQEMKNDAHVSLEECHDLMKWSSMIFRLCNDLATSSAEIENGKLANAISCYMNENGVCEEVAREHINTLIDEAWRKMIEARVDCCQESGDPFIEMAINLARISHCTYQYGDGHGAPDARAKDRVLSVIIEPITIREKLHTDLR
ncbi:hypothetical protein L6452_17482 [Arctium lappa]|uniref:Uncharacterized protein n=1 Tax=Arctium lappa TaxID=4217 RepID=A0ACB9C3R6_ARCLA|nr:hypothetical protein L6452_17482 [Arctium lappa]